MKKYIFLYTSILIVTSPLLVSALTSKPTPVTTIATTTLNAYITCKKTAISHREQTMRPALREYVASSSEITNKAKNNYIKVSWYLDTSYRINAKKIQDEKKQAMIPVTAKINKTRVIAENTWKAEDSLCEILYNTASTTSKKSLKK